MWEKKYPLCLCRLLAPLVWKPLIRDRDAATKHAIAVTEERMKIIEDAEIKGIEPRLPISILKPSARFSSHLPWDTHAYLMQNDLLSATLEVARKDSNANLEYTPMMIVKRILACNFLHSYSNTLTITNVVYDLISLPQEEYDRTVTNIRAELAREVGKPDAWSHEFAHRLEVMDSFIRESLRANPIGEFGLEVTITSKNASLSPMVSIYHAAPFWQHPLRLYNKIGWSVPVSSAPDALEDLTHTSVTTIMPDFLNFGLGRPACPGRWFAVNMQRLAWHICYWSTIFAKD